MDWLRDKLAAWLNIGGYRLITTQQKLINELEDQIQKLYVDVVCDRQKLLRLQEDVQQLPSPDYNLRKDIADFQQRLDALCQVCGVEVVITQGEVMTQIISQPEVDRCQEAAAIHELQQEIATGYARLSQVEGRLRGLKEQKR